MDGESAQEVEDGGKDKELFMRTYGCRLELSVRVKCRKKHKDSRLDSEGAETLTVHAESRWRRMRRG